MSIKLLIDNEYLDELKTCIKYASSEILMTVFHCSYSLAQKKCPVRNLLDSLISSADRNTSVHCIFAHSYISESLRKDNLDSMNYLMNTKIKVTSFNQPRIFHNKFFIFDRKIAIIGSHNLSKTSLMKSAETSLLVESQPVIDRLVTQFFQLLHNSNILW